MKIYKNLVQGTEEWLEERLGLISASNANKILTGKKIGLEGHKTYALELAIERITQEPTFIPVSFAMQQGIDREPYMREIYENSRDVEVVEVGGIKEGDLWYSPDGMVGEWGLIEMKSPEKKQHALNLLSKEPPSQYLPQIQFGLMVSGRDWCDLCTFNPDFPDHLKAKVFRIERDEELIRQMVDRIALFVPIIEGYVKQLKAI